MVHNGHIPMFTSEPEAVSFSPWPRTQCNLCASPSEPKRQQAALQTTSNPKAAILLLSSTATLHTCYKLKLFSSSYQHTTQNLPYSSGRSGCSACMSTTSLLLEGNLESPFCGSQLAMQDPTQYKQKSCELL